MKKHLPACTALAAAACAFLPSAHAATLFSESFSYPAGSLSGKNPGTGPWFVNSGTPTVAAPGMTFPNLATAGNEVVITGHYNGTDLATITLPSVAGGTSGASQVWLSFLINQQRATVSPSSGSTVVELANGPNAVSVGMVGSSASYGIDNNNGTTALLNTYQRAEPVRLVAKFDFANATEFLWFNPSLNAVPSTASAGASLPMPAAVKAAGFTSLSLSATSNMPSFGIDELAVGTTYADVTPLLGDTNADATVDLQDLNTVLNHLGMKSSLRSDGNFDGAATIDLNDLNDVLNHLGASVVGVSSFLPATQPVPEPSTLTVVALAALVLHRRHSRLLRTH